MAALALTQLLLACTVAGDGPVRFGFPLPAAQLVHGLRLEAAPGARLQWRPLHELPDRETGRLWVELALAGASGRVAIHARGQGPGPASGDPAVRVRVEETTDGDRRVRRTCWEWCTGERDERVTTTFLAPAEHEGEVFSAGEALTVESADLAGRCLRVQIAARAWRRAGVLPGNGALASALRAHLVEAATWLQELPGLRGRGDYGRSGGIVTNLEFDTTLALLRLGLAEESPALVARALASARHLVDRDLDPKAGLPFRHGKEHRTAPPEPGHVWLTGLLLAGCVAADDDLRRAARTLAHGLARHPAGQQDEERARDYGWPLLELESWLRFADDTVPRGAADRLAHELIRRWDARNRVLRFGEGERSNGFYEERAWITGGIVLPALRAHLQRRDDADLRAIVASAEQRLLELVLQGKPGLPVRYGVRRGDVKGQVRLRDVPEGYMLLEGLSPPALMRVLKRKVVTRALEDVPKENDPDVATTFTIAARCSWVLR